jgi:hypothetical protein
MSRFLNRLWKLVIVVSGFVTILGLVVAALIGYFVESGFIPEGALIIPEVLFRDGLYYLMFVVFLVSYAAWWGSGRKNF